MAWPPINYMNAQVARAAIMHKVRKQGTFAVISPNKQPSK